MPVWADAEAYRHDVEMASSPHEGTGDTLRNKMGRYDPERWPAPPVGMLEGAVGRLRDGDPKQFPVRWAGSGRELWFARVEIFVSDDSGRLVAPTADALRRLLTEGNPDDLSGCVDQGTGIAEPVIGMVFSVSADGPGAAADTAVAIARQALGDEALALYGVSVFPHATAPEQRDESYPSLND